MSLLIFLIAILALRVKGHSLQDRNVLGRGNVLMVDHHVYIFIYCYTRKGSTPTGIVTVTYGRYCSPLCKCITG